MVGCPPHKDMGNLPHTLMGNWGGGLYQREIRTLYAVDHNRQDFRVPRVPSSLTADGIWKCTPHPRGGQSLRPLSCSDLSRRPRRSISSTAFRARFRETCRLSSVTLLRPQQIHDLVYDKRYFLQFGKERLFAALLCQCGPPSGKTGILQ